MVGLPKQISVRKNRRSRHRFAYFIQRPFAEPIRVEHTVFRKFDNAFGDGFVCEISLIGKFKGCTCHFVCDTRDASSLAIKFDAIQKFGDRHGALPSSGGSATGLSATGACKILVSLDGAAADDVGEFAP